MTADFSNLNLNADYYTGQDQVRIGNGQGLHIHHIGSSILCSSTKDFFLKNILACPSISQNLLSVYQFAKDNNVFFEFHPLSFVSRIYSREPSFSAARVKMVFIPFSLSIK
jgi:hypothetical protein